MGKRTTFITLDRAIMTWRWYQDANTVRLWIHILLKANTKDADFESITVHRGQLVTSYQSLSKELGISVRSARTALNHLKMTGEVTVKTFPKYSVITVLNYEYYQKNRQGERQATDRQATGNRHQSNNINKDKEYIEPATPIESSGSYYDEDAW